MFYHFDSIALVVVLNGTHVRVHKKQTAATWLFDIFRTSGIIDVLVKESLSLVFNAQPNAMLVDRPLDGDLFGIVVLMAVLNGVGKRLFERKLHGKDVTRWKLLVTHLFNYSLPHRGNLAGMRNDCGVGWCVLVFPHRASLPSRVYVVAPSFVESWKNSTPNA